METPPVTPAPADDLQAQLDAAHERIAELQCVLSAWATAASRWNEQRGKIARDHLLQLLDESVLRDRARTVESILRDRDLALDQATVAMASLGLAEQRLAECQLAAGDHLDPVLLAALRAGRILKEAADDADWILGNVGWRPGRLWARQRLQEGLRAADHPDESILEQGTRRAALEALARAARNLRAAIADHDGDSGITWMFDGHSAACERIDLLDEALDALAQSEEQPAAQLLDTAHELVLRQIWAAITAGDVERATIALTALIGEPLGTRVVRELCHLVQTHTTQRAAP
ncbi:MAG TPA: hypothetical protein VFZ66_27525 [Herpetosiphonaceae bacterium]